jgi:hypothetical protein
MNALNRFAEIADLVKGWADKIDNAAGTEYAIVGDVAEEMRAFSNGLRGTIEIFRPIVEAAEEGVAEHNVAGSNLWPHPAPEHTVGGMPIRQCRQRRLHGPHYWRDLSMFACNGNNPMIPEDL